MLQYPPNHDKALAQSLRSAVNAHIIQQHPDIQEMAVNQIWNTFSDEIKRLSSNRIALEYVPCNGPHSHAQLVFTLDYCPESSPLLSGSIDFDRQRELLREIGRVVWTIADIRRIYIDDCTGSYYIQLENPGCRNESVVMGKVTPLNEN